MNANNLDYSYGIGFLDLQLHYNRDLLGNVCDGETHGCQDLDVLRFEKVANEFEAADEAPDHVAGIGSVFDART